MEELFKTEWQAAASSEGMCLSAACIDVRSVVLWLRDPERSLPLARSGAKLVERLASSRYELTGASALNFTARRAEGNALFQKRTFHATERSS